MEAARSAAERNARPEAAALVDPDVAAQVPEPAPPKPLLDEAQEALDEAVVSVTQIHTGTASNIIPEEAMFCATIRSFKPDVRALLKKRFYEIVEGHAAAYGVKARIDYDWGYPATINRAENAAFACDVASEVVG
jgi:hippurate hydrolase